MMRDSKVTGETRVPGLGRIPIIGELFKTRNGKRGKSTLMIFIQPRVLLDAIQTHTETALKYDSVRDLQRTQNNHREMLPLLPFDTPPELPELSPPVPAAPAATGRRRIRERQCRHAESCLAHAALRVRQTPRPRAA
jgi:general secretion pathway protein D